MMTMNKLLKCFEEGKNIRKKADTISESIIMNIPVSEMYYTKMF